MKKWLGLRWPDQWAWALYDFGNSGFAVVMMTAILPLYYADYLADGLESHVRTAYWGYTSALTLALVALTGPSFGALTDRLAVKKRMVVLGTGMGIVGSLLLMGPAQGDWLWGSLFFILANFGYAFGEIFYESLLPSVATKEESHWVSACGYAIGYFGGGVLLIGCLLMVQKPAWFGLEDATMGVRCSFAAVALWWGFFTLPLTKFVKEPPRRVPSDSWHFFSPLVKNLQTLKSLGRNRNLLMFLIAFWAYSDGIGTIIKMATIYGKEVGIGTGDLIGAIVMVQFVGVPFTFLFGYLSEKISEKSALLLTLGVYCFICILGYFMNSALHFWLLAFLVSGVQGGAQSLSRSIFVKLIPEGEASEYFSFYSVSARFAGILGPLLFGLVSQLTGSSRMSILFIILLFIVGILLVRRVQVPQVNREASPIPPQTQ